MQFKTNVVINSDLIDIRDEIEILLEQIQCFVIDKSLLFEIKLILNELVLNSAIHGNDLDDGKKIKLELQIDCNKLKLEIKDEGQGFVYDKTVYDPLELKASGRGLVIVDGLSDELLIDHNKISVVKYLQ